ncbi:MAG: dockerin type I domain-containing protein [Ruminococcus sp.]
MKQHKKRWLSLLTAGLLCLSSFGAMPVSAETDGEAYENDTIATAEAADVNAPIIGALSNSSDVDYYAITLEEDGTLSISFDHAEQSYTNSTYWKITLHDDIGTTLRTWESKGGDTSFQTETMGFHAGTYYIRISSLSHSSDPYTMQCNYTTASASDQLYEFEYNNTFETANPLPVNTSCIGCTYSTSDVDYYAVTLEESGSISILFEHMEQYFTNSDYWKFSILKPDGTTLQKWESTGGVTRFQTNDLGYSAGTYFLKVESAGSFSTDNYTVKVNYTAASASEKLYEAESNDSPDEASVLPVNTPCIGNICNEDDVDYYAVTLEEDGMLQLTFQNPEQYYINSKYWTYSLLDTNQSTMCSWDSIGNATVKQTEKLGLRAGTYYIKVTSSSYSSTDSYTIQAAYTPTQGADTQFEAEYNDTISDANMLLVNTPCIGNIHQEADVDYYAVALEEDSLIQITFQHLEQNYNASNYWSYTLIDTSGKELCSWTSQGGTTLQQTEKLGFRPGTYYIKVVSSSYHSADNYTITVNATTEGVFETEYNDTAATANAVPVATACTGNLYSETDTDYYTFTLDDTSNISLQFTHTSQNYSASTYWKLQLLDAKGKVLESWDSQGGATSMSTEDMMLSAGTYSLAITNGAYHSADNYTIQINAAEIPYLRGDVDEDGDVDADDAYLVLKAYASYSVCGDLGLEGNPLLAADVDENGNVNADDAYYILKYYATASVGGSADWDAIL